MTNADSDPFRLVLEYIDDHLDGDLSLGQLASVAACSPYHFHRRFSALTAMTVARYVQLTRFKRAAWQAAFRPGISVTAMAFDAGYESAEAFSRAFRQRLVQSPSSFRRNPDWRAWASAWRELDNARRWIMQSQHVERTVRIVDFPGVDVACLSHRGPPERIGETLRRFIDWRRARGLHPSKHATWNILFDDPETVAPEAFRLDFCVTYDGVATGEEGVFNAHIPPGRCAVLRHEGAEAFLGSAIRDLYGEWLSASGEVPRDAPLFLQRVRFFPDVGEHEAVTDVFLPLQERAAGTMPVCSAS